MAPLLRPMLLVYCLLVPVLVLVAIEASDVHADRFCWNFTNTLHPGRVRDGDEKRHGNEMAHASRAMIFYQVCAYVRAL